MASTDAAAQSIVSHAEASITEDEVTAAARERAVDSGAGAVTPAARRLRGCSVAA